MILSRIEEKPDDENKTVVYQAQAGVEYYARLEMISDGAMGYYFRSEIYRFSQEDEGLYVCVIYDKEMKEHYLYGWVEIHVMGKI